MLLAEMQVYFGFMHKHLFWRIRIRTILRICI